MVKTEILGVEVVHCTGDELYKEHYCASADSCVKLAEMIASNAEGAIFYKGLPIIYNPGLDK